MSRGNEKNHTPATIVILIGMFLLVVSGIVALFAGSWRVALAGFLGFVAWVIATLAADVLSNRNRT